MKKKAGMYSEKQTQRESTKWSISFYPSERKGYGNNKNIEPRQYSG
jgi:hypothetical protein